MTPTITVLYARKDSIYKTMPGCDVYDIDRDARTWPGGTPVVAHPPCRAWSRMRHLAKPRPDEKGLALHAVDMVRRYGGVLEHPEASSLWPTAGLPRPGYGTDDHGGHAIAVSQRWWGHKAEKPTWLYIVGCAPKNMPVILLSLRAATHCVAKDTRRRSCPLISLSRSARERTPPAFAAWLVELARRCAP